MLLHGCVLVCLSLFVLQLSCSGSIASGRVNYSRQACIMSAEAAVENIHEVVSWSEYFAKCSKTAVKAMLWKWLSLNLVNGDCPCCRDQCCKRSVFARDQCCKRSVFARDQCLQERASVCKRELVYSPCPVAGHVELLKLLAS